MVVKNDPWPIGEPSRLTHEDVGRLCAAWSFLEYVTEQTLWGILDIKPDNKLGPLISWRLDMRGRWQLIIDQAESKHTKEDQATLRDINKKISDATRDRNI